MLGVVEIDAIAVVGMVLDARAGATPKGFIWQVVVSPRTRAKRDIIAHHAGLRILGSQDVVVQRAFIIVGVLSLGLPAEKMAGELEHVVGVTSLRGVGAEGLREFLFRTK